MAEYFNKEINGKVRMIKRTTVREPFPLVDGLFYYKYIDKEIDPDYNTYDINGDKVEFVEYKW